MNQATIAVVVALVASGAVLDRCAPVIGAHATIKRVKADAAEKLEAKGKELDRCQANVRGLEAAQAAQNAAIGEKAALDAERLSTAEKAVGDAQRGRESAEARAAKLLRTPAAGIDACARTEAARRQVLENLR